MKKRSTGFFCVALSTIGLFGSVAHADSPLDVREHVTFCSSSGAFCARSNAAPAHVSVYHGRTSVADPIWQRDEAVPVGFLTDDGSTIVSCYPGLDLVPEDATLDFVVVRILSATGAPREIRLSEIYRSIDDLPRTTSHRAWGRCVGVGRGGVVLERADGSKLVVPLN